MGVNEKTFGPFYAAKMDTNVRFVPSPHWLQIVEMHEPWRKGWAVTLPAIWPSKTIIVGAWKKPSDNKMVEERWLNPHWMDSVSVQDISTWDDLSDAQEAKESI